MQNVLLLYCAHYLVSLNAFIGVICSLLSTLNSKSEDKYIQSVAIRQSILDAVI